MMNLIKYDWMKRWKFFAAGLAVFLFVDIDLTYRIIHKSDPNLISVIFISVLFVLAAALFFDHVGRMYRSLFKEEGQLLFSLPISGYRFLGGKILAVVLECFAVAFLVAGVLYIDFQILARFLPEITLPEQIPTMHLVQGLKVLGLIFLAYMFFLSMVYLSMTLSKSIFSSSKYGGLLSFICFLVVIRIFGALSDLFSRSADYYPGNMPTVTDIGWDSVIMIGFIIIMYTITGYLLDRKINL